MVSYLSRKGELQMTEVDRDIALALLKRLRQRELITEAEYIAACNSRFFDSKHFDAYADLDESNTDGKEDQQT